MRALAVSVVGTVVGGYVTGVLLYWAYVAGFERHSIAGAALYLAASVVAPVGAALRWHERSGANRLERYAATSASFLWTALIAGCLMVVLSLSTAY